MNAVLQRRHPTFFEYGNNIIRAVGIFNYGISLSCHIYFTSTAHKELFGSSFRCITIWAATIQFIYFVLGFYYCIDDIIELSPIGYEIRVGILIFRDYLGETLAFPLSVLVPISFWSVYTFKGEWLPVNELATIPFWLHHMLHTVSFPLQILTIAFDSNANTETLEGTFCISFFYISYFIWLLHIQNQTHEWVYPALNSSSTLIKVVLSATILTGHFALYAFGKWLATTFWGRRRRRIRWSRHNSSIQ
ncbi:androgen-dependent TFPI-regulating protein-like [Cimex lectularius]|uniref:FAR-17a/AIG1-like protein n=1 Tax=Cimex lectularius TaxID=79782 RepID=A0A8I6S860_CIMLE|nr:androgen-dependent TFPI-regulating protein-like [Cimex lectularius]